MTTEWISLAEDDLTEHEVDAANVAYIGLTEWGGAQATVSYTSPDDGHIMADVTVFSDADDNADRIVYYAVARRELPAGPETIIARRA